MRPAARAYLDWKYLNGAQIAPATGLADAAVPFAMPTTPGTYVLKFFSGSTLLATSAPITVASPSLYAQHDDGDGWRHGHRDGRQRAGQRRRLGRRVCHGRIDACSTGSI